MKYNIEDKGNRKSNTMKKFKVFFILLMAAFIIAAFSSCVQDLGGEKEDKMIVSDGAALVTLSLTMPASPATRTPGTLDENRVNTVDVLLFKTMGNNFYYRASGTTPVKDAAASNNENEAKKTFTVKLPLTPSGESYRLVVVANARAEISEFTPMLPISTIVPGSATVYSDVVDGLTRAVALDIPTTAFPMWGEIANVVISESGTTPASLAVNLTRAVARVDVSVKTSDPPEPTDPRFTLSSVHLYNRNTAGLVAPGNALPHLLPSASTTEGPLSYNVPAGKEKSFVRTIYAFEAAGGEDVEGTGWEDNTCLVIGGTYTDASNNAIPTYYRVEFRSGTYPGPYDYLALERNHLYEVAIQEVNAPGWPTKELAYANKPSNIVVTINAWNEGDLNDITFGDQHQIAVDKSSLEFYAEGVAKSLHVTTDYPGGWTVDESDFPGWLHVTAPAPDAVTHVATGAAGQTVELKLTAEALPSGTRPSHEFYIVAGNLKKLITVTQTSDAEFSLEVSPIKITFYKTPGAPRTIIVTSYPLTSSLAFSGARLSSFTWETNLGIPVGQAPPLSSPYTFQVQPEQNTGSSTRSGTLLVTLTDPAGHSIAKTVYIEQLARDMEFHATPSNPYPVAAGTYAFGVMSEGSWKLSEIPSDYPWLALLGDETGFHAPQTTKPYSFTLTNNLGQVAQRTATIAVSSSESFFPFPWTTFEIVQAGYPPLLNITSPVADAGGKHEVDLDAVSPAVVTFETNADWKFTGDSDYAATIGEATHNGASLAEGTSVAVTPASITPISRSVTFSPPSTETPAAGTPLETVVTFETTLGFPVATDAVTLKRIAKPLFSATFSPASGNTLPRTGASVTVTAATNAAWYVEATGIARQDEPATDYATNKTLTATLPTGPSDWSTTKTVTVTASRVDGEPVTATYSQSGYSLTHSTSGVPTSIGGTKKTIPVTFTGNCPAFSLRVVSGSTTLWSGIAAALSGTAPRDFSVPGNLASSRTITLQYYKNGTWVNVQSIVQGEQFALGSVTLTAENATSIICPSNHSYVSPYSANGWGTDWNSLCSFIMYKYNMSSSPPNIGSFPNDTIVFYITYYTANGTEFALLHFNDDGTFDGYYYITPTIGSTYSLLCIAE